MNVLALYGSGRRHGNSEILADRLLEGLDATRIYLAERAIRPIDDKRHTPEGFGPVDDDYDEIVRQMLAHDLLVFATPIYWYGMSAQMKLFVDRWSQSLRDKRFDFRAAMAAKQAYVVLAGGDQPRIKGLPLVQQFHYIFDFVGMGFAGYVIGEGNKPGEVLQDGRALDDVGRLNARLRAQAASAAD